MSFTTTTKMSDYKLQNGAPLHPKILWNRPITKRAAGKLLLIGGHPGNFGQIQSAYEAALAAGVGECGVLVPDSLQPVLAGIPDITFLPSSPSGSLGKDALDRIVKIAGDYDLAILGLNLSNNSETAVLAEALLTRLSLPLVVTAETLQAVKFNAGLAADRDSTLIVADMPALYRLSGRLGVALPSGSGLNGKVAVLDALAEGRPPLWLHFDGEMILKTPEETAVTATELPEPALPTLLAACATMWLQHPNQASAAITTACFLVSEAIKAAEIPLTTQTLSRSLKEALSSFSG